VLTKKEIISLPLAVSEAEYTEPVGNTGWPQKEANTELSMNRIKSY